ncbi:5849_t:CDS:1, partial [Funneliformis geosporum]
SIDTDTKDFIIIPHLTPFTYAIIINKTAKEFLTNTIIKTINEKFASDDAFKGINIRHVNLT